MKLDYRRELPVPACLCVGCKRLGGRRGFFGTPCTTSNSPASWRRWRSDIMAWTSKLKRAARDLRMRCTSSTIGSRAIIFNPLRALPACRLSEAGIPADSRFRRLRLAWSRSRCACSSRSRGNPFREPLPAQYGQRPLLPPSVRLLAERAQSARALPRRSSRAREVRGEGEGGVLRRRHLPIVPRRGRAEIRIFESASAGYATIFASLAGGRGFVTRDSAARSGS